MAGSIGLFLAVTVVARHSMTALVTVVESARDSPIPGIAQLSCEFRRDLPLVLEIPALPGRQNARPERPDSCVNRLQWHCMAPRCDATRHPSIPKILRKLLYMRRTARRVPLLSGWRNDVRFFWHTRSKAPWIAALIVGVAITTFGALAYWLESNSSEKRELTCLALNVYYEARGEPLAGKYAVAEVTMNRVASRRYPGTVCEVVYEKRWDRLRKRYVGAFSWTEFDIIPHPEGEQWHQAREVAEAVYFGRQPPQLNGALHYHATYIRPSWTQGRQPIARIGGHVFYK
jgi:N-acetylmuramoyl-L-alanine amidase